MATTTAQLIMMVSVMLAMNIGLALYQGGIAEVNPDGSSFFDVANSPYSKYVVNGTLIVDSTYLPTDDTVDVSTGNIFTDTYASIKGWTQNKLAPLNFVANVLKQPYGFLRDIGVSTSIALALGVLWYMIAIILLVSWWMGRG